VESPADELISAWTAGPADVHELCPGAAGSARSQGRAAASTTSFAQTPSTCNSRRDWQISSAIWHHLHSGRSARNAQGGWPSHRYACRTWLAEMAAREGDDCLSSTGVAPEGRAADILGGGLMSRLSRPTQTSLEEMATLGQSPGQARECSGPKAETEG